MTGLEIAVAAYVAYLLGSLSSAIITCRLMQLPDPRTQGSGNPGATNVLRLGNKKAAIVTLIGDMLKGLIPVLAVKWYGAPLEVQSLVALCAFLGHIFPIYYRFSGGKGVATYIACLFAINWMVGIAWVLAWLIMVAIFRFVSLASITASLLTPLYLWFFTQNWVVVAIFSVMTMLLIVRHYANIIKLAQGEESKIT